MGPYVFPDKECPACGKALLQRKDVQCDAILIGSESITDSDSILQMCNRCRTNVRHNIMFLRGEKINTMTYNEMASSGALFVNSLTTFAMDYLHLTIAGFSGLGLLQDKRQVCWNCTMRVMADSFTSRTLEIISYMSRSFCIGKANSRRSRSVQSRGTLQTPWWTYKDFLFPPPRPLKSSWI